MIRRFLAVVAIGLAVGGCSRLSSEQVSELATEITVLIDGCNAGSGVIFKHDSNTYSVLTASHVVKNTNGNCLIITSDKERYTASDEVIFPLPGVDLAVLKFQSSKTYKLAEWSDSDLVSIGKSVYVAGAPALSEVIQERDVEVQGGKIIRTQLSKSVEGYALVYNSSTLKGMSGGPVLNEEGRVIGIHGYKDPQEGSKNGRNLGIPINKFLAAYVVPIPDGSWTTGGATFLWPILLAVILLIPILVIGGSFYLIFYGCYNKDIANQKIYIIMEKLGWIFILFWISILILGGRGILDISYFIQGNIYQQLGDYQAAIAAYNKAIKINPNYAYAYVGRGVAYNQLGDEFGDIASYYWSIYFSKENAKQYCNWRYGESCTLINPNDTLAYYNRGVEYYKLGKKQKAIAYLNKVIQLVPNFSSAYNNRGVIYSQLGEQQQALADYNKAIQLDPNYGDPYYNRGLIRREHLFPKDLVFRKDSIFSSYSHRKYEALQDFKKAAELFQKKGNQYWYQQSLNRINELR